MDENFMLLIGVVSALFWICNMLAILGRLKELSEHARTHTQQNDRIIELLKRSAVRSEEQPPS
ncbi:hypothetical protein [Paenibacillus sp. MBLB4367]|uniref:hypothetical protein n=1 Tax=Paenibacillus sp. MBLB4367 TaxID=3384767 RepID=UPI0039082D51